MIEEDLIRIESKLDLLLSRTEPKAPKEVSEERMKAKLSLKRFMTITEASEYTGYSKSNLRLLCSKGLIRCQRQGRMITIRISDLDDYMEGITEGSVSQKADAVCSKLKPLAFG